jgi:hypothetical protein
MLFGETVGVNLAVFVPNCARMGFIPGTIITPGRCAPSATDVSDFHARKTRFTVSIDARKMP